MARNRKILRLLKKLSIFNDKKNNKNIKRKKKKIINLKNNKHTEEISLSNIEFALIVLIGMILGAGLTLLFVKPNNIIKYEKVDENIQSIIDTYNHILDNYYTELSEEDVATGAVKGMLEAINDPYTTYMDEDLYNNFNINLEGSYEGLGLEITKQSNEIVIVGLFADSPAKNAGLELGDIIVSIDGKSSAEMNTSDFSKYVRESSNETFKIVVKRDGEEKEYNITRKRITLKSVYSEVLEEENKRIGYMYVSIFANNSYEQFKENLATLEKEKVDALIIDLRDNSGGELKTVTNIISLFIKNDKVIYQIESRDGSVEKTYSNGKKDADYPIVVLVNGNTASASEVMAAALRDDLNAIIIGTKTYGKGTVQTVLTTSTGEQYKMTTKKWLTPSGEWINGVGLIPNVEIEMTSDKDNQLTESIKYIVEH